MIGRTKVAPLNEESILKLELQAAVNCTGCCKFTTEDFRLNFKAIHFWKVSKTALAWMNTPEKHNFTGRTELTKLCQFLKPNSGIITR